MVRLRLGSLKHIIFALTFVLGWASPPSFAQVGPQTKNAAPAPTKPDFTASTLSGPAPLTVELRAVPIGTADATYSWNFTTSLDTPGQTASFTFEEPGEYAVALKVQSGDWLRTETKVIEVTGGDAAVSQRPYTINTGEVGEGVRISAFELGAVYTDSATTVPVANPSKNVINYYSLFDENSVIAMDVVIPGIKEDISFNARNSVLAAALYAPPDFYGVPIEVLGEFYKRFPAHPDFDPIVEGVREGRQLYNSSDTTERIIKLTNDVAKAYLIEGGLFPTAPTP